MASRNDFSQCALPGRVGDDAVAILALLVVPQDLRRQQILGELRVALVQHVADLQPGSHLRPRGRRLRRGLRLGRARLRRGFRRIGGEAAGSGSSSARVIASQRRGRGVADQYRMRIDLPWI